MILFEIMTIIAKLQHFTNKVLNFISRRQLLTERLKKNFKLYYFKTKSSNYNSAFWFH